MTARVLPNVLQTITGRPGDVVYVNDIVEATGFTEMLQRAPERALAWRLDVRQMFDEYFAKGYRAVDFVLQRDAGFGRYLLAKD